MDTDHAQPISNPSSIFFISLTSAGSPTLPCGQNFVNKNFHIEAVDLNPKAVAGLKKKFSTNNVTVRQADTLLDFKNDLFGDRNFFFNKIIGNPPYGAWQDLKKRELLKNMYGGYVKETYTLFLRKCIDLLKENGRLVFIVPDTFLALHMQ